MALLLFTTETLIGAARGIVDWFDLRGEQYLATGTNKKLYVYQNNAWYDITPTRATATGNITGFTTVNNSPTGHRNRCSKRRNRR